MTLAIHCHLRHFLRGMRSNTRYPFLPNGPADASVDNAQGRPQAREAALTAALAEGFGDLEAGRIVPFDLERILAAVAGQNVPLSDGDVAPIHGGRP